MLPLFFLLQTVDAAAVLFSPWTDPTLGGRSVHEKAHSDVLLEPAKLADAAKAYVGALPLDDTRASPLFCIPRDLPPILIQVGSEEFSLTMRAAMLSSPARQAHRSRWRCGRACTTYSSSM